jgi:hypothetical protein
VPPATVWPAGGAAGRRRGPPAAGGGGPPAAPGSRLPAAAAAAGPQPRAITKPYEFIRFEAASELVSGIFVG